MRRVIIALMMLAAPAAAGKGAPSRLGGHDVAVSVSKSAITIRDRASGEQLWYLPRSGEKVRWQDLNSDGVPELEIGDRIFQLRWGRLVEQAPAVVKCAIAADDTVALGEDPTADQRAAAIQRFVDGLDLHDPDDVTLCHANDAIVATEIDAPLPAVGTFAIAPIAATCPGIDWAERHGRTIPLQREGVYLGVAGTVVHFTARADHLSVDAVAESAKYPISATGIVPWIADQQLVVFIDESNGTTGVYEVASGEVVSVKRTGDAPLEVKLSDNVLREVGSAWNRKVITAWQP